MNQSTPLSPQQEQQAVDAITTLDWNTDPVGPARDAIAAKLSLPKDRATDVLIDLEKRGVIHQRPERPANNLAESGVKSDPIRSKWFRG
jgi:hypothetical protein